MSKANSNSVDETVRTARLDACPKARSSFARQLVCLVAALCLFFPSTRASAQDSSAPGQISVVTDPPGAYVSLDGSAKGASPIALNIPRPGPHLISVKKMGYLEERRTVEIAAGQKLPLEIKLRQETGWVLIKSKPAGASVQVAGVDKGTTPTFLSDVSFGKYTVTLSKAGSQPKTIDLVIDSRVPKLLNVILTSDSAELKVVTDPPGAEVKLNGVAKSSTPCTIEDIPAGEASLELTLEGYRPYAQTIKLAAGQKSDLNIPLSALPSELKIVSIPSGARVYVNNEYKGESPLTLKNIPAGEYRVRTELKGYAALPRTITLPKAASVTEEFKMERNCGILQVITEPAGVSVFVDGENVGITQAVRTNESTSVSDPLVVDLLAIGPHKVQMTLKGYDDEQIDVTIAKNETASVQKSLKRRWIVDYEVKTVAEVFRGMHMETDILGNIKLQIAPGVYKTVNARDIRAHGPIRAGN